MDGSSYVIVILLLVAAWVIQLGLSTWQMKRYYARLRQLRRYGTVAVGMTGSAWRRRVYGLLAVDEQERVVRAEKLSGWTVFAVPIEVPQLQGYSVQAILDGAVNGLSHKELAAFQQAAAFLRKHMTERQGEPPSAAEEGGKDGKQK